MRSIARRPLSVGCNARRPRWGWPVSRPGCRHTPRVGLSRFCRASLCRIRRHRTRLGLRTCGGGWLAAATRLNRPALGKPCTSIVVVPGLVRRVPAGARFGRAGTPAPTRARAFRDTCGLAPLRDRVQSIPSAVRSTVGAGPAAGAAPRSPGPAPCGPPAVGGRRPPGPDRSEWPAPRRGPPSAGPPR